MNTAGSDPNYMFKFPIPPDQSPETFLSVKPGATTGNPGVLMKQVLYGQWLRPRASEDRYARLVATVSFA